jgi:erythromycin esterase-like protein/adenine/guanine phosphoribosyltransferase-like PRPP-binding protein
MENFTDRHQAGKLLAKKLNRFKSEDPVILALPRGGVPLGYEVAQSLNAPLDVLLVKKIGAPSHSEFAVGAITEDEEPLLNRKVIDRFNFDLRQIHEITLRKIKELRAQGKKFRGSRKMIDVENRTVILVDDGIATGSTTKVCIDFLKKKKVKKIIVATPVAPAETIELLRGQVDEIICLMMPEDFFSVGQFYEKFGDVEDEEVIKLLSERPDMNDLERTTHSFRDIDKLIEVLADKKIVMLGEASHGTSEFYKMRALISKNLIENHGFNFVAVEGDWPDSQRLNAYIEGRSDQSVRQIMAGFHRWPTWMWANEETADFIEWLKKRKAGFYGLDVYSLFDSIDAINDFLKQYDPDMSKRVRARYACFEPFEGDEISYAKSLYVDPAGCEPHVMDNLREILEMHLKKGFEGEIFNLQQNARIIKNAERYYRSMIYAGDQSWNIRDEHMMETLSILLEKMGPDSKAIVWAHNTHIGDYRATDMAKAGYVNIGGLARQQYGDENVALVGFGTYEGTLIAGHAWGAPMEVMNLPQGLPGTWEDYCHQICKSRRWTQFFTLNDVHSANSVLAQKPIGHRAVGVVYEQGKETHGRNYVPSVIAKRYDAFVFIDKTTALHPIHAMKAYGEIPETWPLGQ